MGKTVRQLLSGSTGNHILPFFGGTVKSAPAERKRRSVYCRSFPLETGRKAFRCSFSRMAKKIPTTAQERERKTNKKNCSPIGILGEVNLYLS